jgi:hypothetical protein
MAARQDLFRLRNSSLASLVAASLLVAPALQGKAFAARGHTLAGLASEGRSAGTERTRAQPRSQTVASNDRIQGTWQGQYICGQGVTELVLTVSGSQYENLSATFRFEVRRDKPIRGEFLMAGYYEPADRSLNLSPLEWVVRPPGYIAVGIEAKMNAEGDVLEGRIMSSACSWVRLRR